MQKDETIYWVKNFNLFEKDRIKRARKNLK